MVRKRLIGRRYYSSSAVAAVVIALLSSSSSSRPRGGLCRAEMVEEIPPYSHEGNSNNGSIPEKRSVIRPETSVGIDSLSPPEADVSTSTTTIDDATTTTTTTTIKDIPSKTVLSGDILDTVVPHSASTRIDNEESTATLHDNPVNDYDDDSETVDTPSNNGGGAREDKDENHEDQETRSIEDHSVVDSSDEVRAEEAEVATSQSNTDGSAGPSIEDSETTTTDPSNVEQESVIADRGINDDENTISGDMDQSLPSESVGEQESPQSSNFDIENEAGTSSSSSSSTHGTARHDTEVSSERINEDYSDSSKVASVEEGDREDQSQLEPAEKEAHLVDENGSSELDGRHDNHENPPQGMDDDSNANRDPNLSQDEETTNDMVEETAPAETIEEGQTPMSDSGSSETESQNKDESSKSAEKEADVVDEDSPTEENQFQTGAGNEKYSSDDEKKTTKNGDVLDEAAPASDNEDKSQNEKLNVESDTIDFDLLDENGVENALIEDVPGKKNDVADERGETKDPSSAKVDETESAVDEITAAPENESSSNTPDDEPDKASPEDNKESKPAPKGSLASFFEKVNKKENAPKKQSNIGLQAGGTTSSFAERAQAAEEINVLTQKQQQQQQQQRWQFGAKETAQKPPPPKKLEDYPPKEYSGSWGVNLKQHRPADLDLLFLVFQDHVRKQTGGGFYDLPHKEAIFPLGVGSNLDDDDSLESPLNGSGPIPEELIGNASNILKEVESKNSVNSDFVEGIDDIDKFFEGVDPPDELDVGASGATMQEVLMGKGREILFKRIGLGYKFVCAGVSSIQKKLRGFVQVDRFKNDEGRLAVTPENLADAGKGVWAAFTTTFRRVVDFFDDLIDGEDLDGDMIDMDMDFSQLGLRDPSLGNAGPIRTPLQEEGQV